MAEPITEDEARLHLRLSANEPAALLESYISAAREWVEDYTGHILVRREVTEVRKALAAGMSLSAWPVDADQSVSIRYWDYSGTLHEITGVELRTAARPARLVLPSAISWGRAQACNVEITFTAGYADAAAVPQKFKQAMLLLITAYFEEREGGPMMEAAEAAARRLCRKEKSWRV